MPVDPLSVAQGGLQAIGGLAQLIAANPRKHQRNLEKHINSYRKNESIMDYYTKAMNRFNQNPYNSASYKNAMQAADRGLVTGLNSLQGRRSALAGTPGLVQGYADAGLRAAANAEREQAGALAQLGSATQMKAREDNVPFEMRYNLLAQRASGADAQKAAGWKNLFGGLSAASTGLIPGAGKGVSGGMGIGAIGRPISGGSASSIASYIDHDNG